MRYNYLEQSMGVQMEEYKTYIWVKCQVYHYVETEFTMCITGVMALVINLWRFITVNITTTITTLRWTVSVEDRQPSHPLL